MELRPRARASAAQREFALQMGRRSLQAETKRSEFLVFALPPFLLPDQQSDQTATYSFVSQASFNRGLWAPDL
jgi:hypothetical protein